jgi:hypothetical protein
MMPAFKTIPVGLGLSNAGSFFELLNGLAQGQPWDFAEFAKRLAAFSSPTGLGVALMLGLELLLGRGEMTHVRSLRNLEGHAFTSTSFETQTVPLDLNGSRQTGSPSATRPLA